MSLFDTAKPHPTAERRRLNKFNIMLDEYVRDILSNNYPHLIEISAIETLTGAGKPAVEAIARASRITIKT